MKFGKLSVTSGRVGKAVLTVVKYGKQLAWQLGNFFTKDGEVFLTSDNEVFEVLEENEE